MRINPKENLHGEFYVLPDKSITLRAIMLGAIASGKTSIVNPLMCDETYTVLSCIKKLGAKVKIKNGVLDIRGTKKVNDNIKIDCDDSAFAMRMLCGVAAGSKARVILTGSKKLSQIPMKQVKEPLEKMGATVALTNYSVPPILVDGDAIRSIEYEMPVGFSMVKGAILLSAVMGEVRAKIIEKTRSRNHMEILLKEMGARIRFDKESGATVLEKSRIHGEKIYICGDFSCAVYFLALGLLSGSVTVRNVGINPTRTKALDIIRRMGGRIEVKNKRMLSGEMIADVTSYKSDLRAVHVLSEESVTIMDELPALAVLMGAARGESIICDATDAFRYKEFGSFDKIVDMLTAIGGKCKKFGGGIIISGVEKYDGGEIKNCDDAFITMAAAIALMCSSQGGEIASVDSVEKVYPSFFDCLSYNSFAMFGNALTENRNDIHAFLLKELGLDNFTYSTINTSAKGLKKAFSELKEYDAYNVASVYSNDAVKRVMKLRGAAKVTKTVDTVKGSVGHCSIGNAFYLALKNADVSLAEKRVLVIGCGFAGKNIIHRLIELKSRVDVYDIVSRNALDFKRRLKENIYVLREISEDTEYDVIVNATPLGGKGYESKCPVAAEIITKCPIAVDINSVDGGTKFIKIAKKAGNKVITGDEINFFKAYYSDCVFAEAGNSEEEAFELFGKFVK